jgi:integrase
MATTGKTRHRSAIARPGASPPSRAYAGPRGPQRRSSPIEPRNFNRSFSRCIAAVKVPVITVHGTLKTCGSLLAALDVHPRVAMHILRHSKIAVTMEIYTEVPSATTREALGKLGQWLDSDS